MEKELREIDTMMGGMENVSNFFKSDLTKLDKRKK